MGAAFDLSAMLGTQNQAVQQIPCNALIPYHNHKFGLYEGERLDDMVQSIKEKGVLSPIIVQPAPEGNGKYEILIGHNRWNASIIAGKPTVPAIIKTGLSEEEAEIYVVESNIIQRGFDNLPISEQAAVISTQYQRIFSQGKRNDIIRELKLIENPEIADAEPSEDKPQNSREIVGSEYGLGKNTVARLIRIDKLCDNLKPFVDNKSLPIRAAVDISYLSADVQETLAELMEEYKIDMKKAKQLKDNADEDGNVSEANIIKILTGTLTEKKPKPKTVKINPDIYEKYFDEDVKADEVSEIIEEALAMYFAETEQAPVE